MNKMYLLMLLVFLNSEKVSQFMIPLKLIYNKNMCFNEQKCISKRRRNVTTIKETTAF